MLDAVNEDVTELAVVKVALYAAVVLKSCADEIYPKVPNPTIVDVKLVAVIEAPELRYPAVPNPLTVDCKEDSRRDVLTILLSEEKYFTHQVLFQFLPIKAYP